MRLDQIEYRRRARWTMSVSFVAHAIILALIVLAPRVGPQGPALTEIVMVEPGDLGGPPSPPTASAPAYVERTGAAVSHATSATFRRSTSSDELTPEPQSADAVADRIASRLASIQASEPVPVKGVSSSALSSVWSTPSAPGPASGGGGSALSLQRGGGGTSSGPSLSLHRGGSTPGPAVVPTGLPAGEQATATPARGGETTARRVAAGAMLAGPIADRPVISSTRPVYPEWAKRDAVEGSVTLYFVVRPDGAVKENVLVQKTAGFEDFDESARTALRQWRFAPLREGRTGEQWGLVTFHYRLREAG
jgi:protein TonB